MSGFCVGRRISMSDLRRIENDRLIVEVEDAGGQLVSIFDKKNNKDIIWSGDENYWKWHAPTLFPFVGELYDKKIKYEGVVYPMTAHGFARESQFEFVGIEDDRIIHRLLPDKEKRAVYPFEFEFTVIHSIEDNKLKVEWIVENKDDKEMLFQVGGHPAFNVPMPDRKDYYLNFGKGKQELKYIQISKDGGTALVDDVKTLKLEDGLLKIGEHLFDNGVLIFEDNQLDEVGINYPDKKPFINVKCQGFPYVGIWTKPANPFVCIEPWYGRCDDYGFDGELSEKTGIVKLDSKKTFSATFYIEVL